MRRFLMISAMLAVFGAAPATAQGTAQERSDCMGDAFKFCSGDIPFVEEIESCLQANMARLSSACRKEFASSPTNNTKLTEEHFR